MKKLDTNEIIHTIKNYPNWVYKNGYIEGSFEFKDFKEAFTAMTRIAFEAEAQEHHPDWYNVYNKLTVKLSTHDAGGVTENDFKLAGIIDQIISKN